MSTKLAEDKLLAKQFTLRRELAALEAEPRERPDVGDSIDAADEDQANSESLDEAAILSQTLQQVQDALDRVKAGTYGKCINCDRPIEPNRLAAEPWAEYCLEDQEKLERRHSTA